MSEHICKFLFVLQRGSGLQLNFCCVNVGKLTAGDSDGCNLPDGVTLEVVCEDARGRIGVGVGVGEIAQR